ncbi:ATP-grasp domain-containing protein [Exiguobacterium sp. s189]|uniref:ATP-grasp domain-containing protein n=1 Tax=Exiguobacterium sp. s189 TaxID=2751263 RepID=UPI001BE54468|nr:ATP-grasp domain-containing protein [Exiguobacterium sp. s189]
MKNPTIIFVESNTTGTGMHAFQLAREEGLNCILLTRKIELYTCIPEYIKIIEVDTNNYKTVEETVQKLVDSDQVEGIMTTSEFYIPIVSRLCERFKFPSNTLEFVNICRNKIRTRKILTELRLPQPRYTVISKDEDLKEALHPFDFPVIVKPYNESGSNGVKLCSNLVEAINHCSSLLNITHNSRGFELERKVLVEEFIGGEEYSVETFFDKSIEVIGVTKKFVIGEPYFVEKSHIYPAAIKEDVKNEIIGTVKHCLNHIGYTFGPAHVEVKIRNNKCYIIEINPRLAGGMIPELIKQSEGVDTLRNYLYATIGKEKRLEKKHESFSQITFITADSDGVLKDIHFSKEVESMDYFGYKNKNSNVRIPENAGDRVGFIITNKTKYLDVLEDIEKINNGTTLVIK